MQLRPLGEAACPLGLVALITLRAWADVQRIWLAPLASLRGRQEPLIHQLDHYALSSSPKPEQDPPQEASMIHHQENAPFPQEH